MEKTEKEFCEETLSVTTDVLRMVIISTLKKDFGDQWWKQGVEPKISDVESFKIPDGDTDEDKIKNADFPFLLKIVKTYYLSGDPFEGVISKRQFNYLMEIRLDRNEMAHKYMTVEPPTSFAERMADTAFQFISDFGIFKDQANEVSDIEKQLAAKNKAIDVVPSESKPDDSAGLVPEESSALPSWRTIAYPRPEITKGDFNSGTFALNLSSLMVNGETNGSTLEAPLSFFDRTYLTAGLKSLLKQVALRLAGKSGDGVIEVKTSFGGGKTHSMLAAYYMVTNPTRIDSLTGVRDILNDAGVSGIPNSVCTAVIVGTNLSTTNAKKAEGTMINTLWGELAYQVAASSKKPEIFEAFKKVDHDNSTPTLQEFLTMFKEAGPTILFIDELVAYARKLDGTNAIGGTLDSFVTGIQALTEAVSQTKDCLLICSIPESEAELGGERGRQVAESLSKIFGRMETPWQTASQDESFNIVRRRIFSERTANDEKKIRAVCKKFIEMYSDNKELFGRYSTDPNYLDRMVECYPFHPSVFDDLYDKWGSLENFQRTRSLLNLLSSVVNFQWNDNDTSVLIMPGNLPLNKGKIKDTLIGLLNNDAWRSVVDSEIIGSNSVARNLDKKDASLGKCLACQRVSSSLFLGTAPTASLAAQRGLSQEDIIASVATPNDGSPYIFKNAIDKVKESSNYVDTNGKVYWVDTAPNLNKLISSFEKQLDKDAINEKTKLFIQKQINLSYGSYSQPLIWPVSDFDVTDDGTLKIVVLPINFGFSKSSSENQSSDYIRKIIVNHGPSKRIVKNSIIFLAPDNTMAVELVNKVKTYLALEKVQADQSLNASQINAIKTRQKETSNIINSYVCSTYKWVLVPKQSDSDAEHLTFVERELSGSNEIIKEVEEILCANEDLINVWSPKGLKLELDKFYLSSDESTGKKKVIKISDLYDDHCKYLYLPRLTNIQVLTDAVSKELQSGGTEFGYCGSINENGEPVNVKIGASSSDFGFVATDGYLVETNCALAIALKEKGVTPGKPDAPSGDKPIVPGDKPVTPPTIEVDKMTHFTMQDEVVADKNMAKRVIDIYNNIVKVLDGDSKITIIVESSKPSGFDEKVQKDVTGNAETLGIKLHQFDK
jgi:predicted AAA+ superfamily ATPase